MAYSNPHWKEMKRESVTAVFHGPHAFVDHNWYTHPSQQVPTWNYAVTHVEGEISFFHDYKSLIEVLDKLQQVLKPGPSWGEVAPEPLKTNLEKGIVGFSLSLRSMKTKLKLSQNRSEQDPFRVMNAFQASARQEDQDVAKLMNLFLTK